MTKNNKMKKVLETVCAFFVSLVVWHIVSITVANDIIIVSPLAVLARLTTIWKEAGFLSSLLFSFSRIAIGFIAAVLTGTFLSIIAHRLHAVKVLLAPPMAAVKAVPVASFIIIALVWLDSASLSTFISFLIVLPTVYTNILSGLEAIPTGLAEMAKVFGVRGIRRLVYISLPCLKPYIMSSASVTVGLAFKSGIAAEVIGIPDGSIGERLYQAKIYLETPDLLAWTVIIVILSVIFEKLTIVLIRLGYKLLER